ncbi:HU family DNA-binding protein [Fodinibius sp.]|uniref:HU family DNA-binding protein n=1 Tax=Fodinibius sp. TaxID=1872440 RepID=UPI002ACD580E|nr:HU family DNA-binding protein [Fodinibius sp.]MDZ7659311.1 HU family DNA-binding protein [Fodinibius sp.]
MNTSDVVAILAENWDMTQAEARELLDVITQTFNENIATGNSFTIPKLGTFSTKTRKKRKSYNPHYEQYMELPPKRVVDFNPSQGLKEDFKQADISDE